MPCGGSHYNPRTSSMSLIDLIFEEDGYSQALKTGTVSKLFPLWHLPEEWCHDSHLQWLQILQPKLESQSTKEFSKGNHKYNLVGCAWTLWRMDHMGNCDVENDQSVKRPFSSELGTSFSMGGPKAKINALVQHMLIIIFVPILGVSPVGFPYLIWYRNTHL